MHIAEIKEDDSGELMTGCFYQITPWPDDDPPKIEGIIVSAPPPEASPLYLDFDDEKWERPYECPVDKSHRSGGHLKRLEVMSLGGKSDPIAKCTASYHIVVRADVLASLAKAMLKGLRGVKCDAVDDDGRKIDIPYFALSFDGKDAARTPIVLPATANKCPFCDYGPLICPGCGELQFFTCPKCMKECVKTRGDDESTAPIRFNGTPDDGIVLDGSRWDGNDFIACHGTFVVTRCVVSALLKIHAYAFRAIPLRTYVGSCTKQQRTELDKLKNA